MPVRNVNNIKVEESPKQKKDIQFALMAELKIHWLYLL